MAEDFSDMIRFLEARKGQSLQSTQAQPAPAVQEAPQAAPQQTGQFDVLPMAKDAFGSIVGAMQNAPPGKLVGTGNLSWFERNQRRDENGKPIELDVENGIDLGDYARMVWQRRPEERLSVLRKMFPNQIVRLSDTGEPIVEVLGKNGVRKDVIVNPMGFDTRDVAEIGASGPEMAGGAVGSILGGIGGSAIAGPPGGFAGRILGGAAGVGFVGGLKDIVARKSEGIPVNFEEIQKSRSEEAELNALLDLGLSGVAKGLRITAPFAGSRGPLEFNADKAQEYFKRRWGVSEKDMPRTPGEITGSKMLKRIEAFEAPQPGASTIIGNIHKRTEDTITRIISEATGKAMPEEQLGKNIIADLEAKVAKPVMDAVDVARDELVKKGESELVNVIDSLTGVTSTTRKAAGDAAREAFADRRKVAKSLVDADYAAVRALPGGTGKHLATDPLLTAFQDIMNELPKVTTTTQKTIYSQYGNPMTRTVVSNEILPSGRPEGLMTFLADMKKLKSQKMSLDELTKLKNAANDEIAKTEAVPGVKDRWFSKIAEAYDTAVVKGAEDIGNKLGNTDLKDALLKARSTYKKELLPLDREGLHDILRTEFEAGFQSPEQIVNRLFSGVRAEHNYRVLKETIGGNSPAFQKVKRSVLDSWVGEATDKLTGRIDPGKLEEALGAFSSSHPEIYSDLIPKGQEKQLFQITRSLKAAGKEIKDLDPDELSQLLRTGNVTRPNIIKLADAQKVRDETFANPILKQIKADGKLPPDVSPVKFVRSLFNTDIDTQFVKDSIANLSAADKEILQTSALYRIIDKAGELKSAYAPLYVSGKQSPVSAQGLMEAMGKPGSVERARNELLLGPDHAELVKSVISVLAPREIKAQEFKMSGSLASAMTISELLRHPLNYAKSFTTKLFAAVAYTSKPMRNLIANQVEGPKETAAFANLLVASEPFVRKVYEVVQDEEVAKSIVADLKQSIDRYATESTQPTEGEAQFNEMMNFLRTKKGKVKIEARP